ncbi:unnamed protein product [Ambrosiozyma monospora]|uniref:Unnamed protein product n=1 Tax=Ambrosiozyma monospora TaxID=43982 RepID=A0A9W6Z7Q9_AMBMO|nr:unnamed protein product [Ambrosiozyma monospora]
MVEAETTSTGPTSVDSGLTDSQDMISDLKEFKLASLRRKSLQDTTSGVELNTVNTDDCARPPTIGKTENKYILNSDFNSPIKDHSNDNSTNNDKHNDSLPVKKLPTQPWMPDILQDETWPDLTSNTVQRSGDQAATNATDNFNPYLSFNASMLGNTMIKNDHSSARGKADWRKYQNDHFKDQISQRTINLLPINDSQEYIPDTFANKAKHKNPSADSLVPTSPLKLFGGGANTYTKGKMKDILNIIDNKNIMNIIHDGSVEINKQYQKSGTLSSQLADDGDDKINQIVSNSDAFYNDLIKKTPRLVSKTASNTSITYSASDYTSDADELGSMHSDYNPFAPNDTEKNNRLFNSSTANDYVKAGDNLFNNLKKKLGPTLPTSVNDYSDYTSDGNDGDADNDDEIDDDEDDDLSNSSGIGKINETDTDVTPQEDYVNVHANADITATLDQLRHEFSNDTPKKGDISVSVPVPKIKRSINFFENLQKEGENSTKLPKKKPAGINFIPADDYKGKVYDKFQKKNTNTQ